MSSLWFIYSLNFITFSSISLNKIIALAKREIVVIKILQKKSFDIEISTKLHPLKEKKNEKTKCTFYFYLFIMIDQCQSVGTISHQLLFYALAQFVFSVRCAITGKILTSEKSRGAQQHRRSYFLLTENVYSFTLSKSSRQEIITPLSFRTWTATSVLVFSVVLT